MKKGELIKSNQKMIDKDMEQINKLTRRQLSADEAYTFTVVLCDNDIDRDNERFTVESLFALQKMFIGKTGILDHNPKADNQTARIYDTYVESIDSQRTKTGDEYFRLVAKAYVIKSVSQDIVSKIDGGILKEVSVGCAVERTICSICGNDLYSHLCTHTKGKLYDNSLCYGELTNPTDAYEWSFVPVPSQKGAGVIKHHQYSKGKEKEMKEILNSISKNVQVTLSSAECKRLSQYVDSLKNLAHDGEVYRENLTNEVMRLSVILTKGIKETTAQNMLKGLSIDELLDVKSVYEKHMSSSIPTPQLIKANDITKEKVNTDYTI